MIVGNGMIANAFRAFDTTDDVVIFASGVANSLETDPDQFKRESDLLDLWRNKYPHSLFVYFSTCSSADSDRLDTPYVQHKLLMEKKLAGYSNNYIVFRLPVVIGASNCAKTLPYFLYKKIQLRESFEIWEHAIRYPIDIEHVVKICTHMIGQSKHHGQVLNVALKGACVSEIVDTLEELLGRKALANPIQKGSHYSIDCDLALELAKKLNIEVGQSYIRDVLNKYFINSKMNSSEELPAVAGGRPVRSQLLVFSEPVIDVEETEAVVECLQSRWIGMGPRVTAFERAFAEYKSASFSVALNSGSSALHLALLALDIGPGDEVIAPTMTFIASTHAILHTGATPVLIDCDPHTYNIDVDAIEAAITPRTRAIMVVHLYGRCCEMVRIKSLAEKYNLKIIEDCAHAVESTYLDESAGLLGDVGCFSFYATKSITTGDGGMVITHDEGVYRKVRELAMHGIDVDAWSRMNHKQTNYSVTALGFKYNMTDIEAALGIVQLKYVESRWRARQRHWQLLNRELESLPLVTPNTETPGSRHGYHLYTVLVDPEVAGINRDELILAMRAENISTGIHYKPVHRHPYYRESFGYTDDQFPVATSISEKILSLPINADLSDSEMAAVSRALKRIFNYYTV